MTLPHSFLRRSLALALPLLALILDAAFLPASAQAPVPSRLTLSLTNQTAYLTFQGRSNLLIRIDGSRDLRNWETEWLFTLSNSLVTLTRTNTEPMRFWRAIELSSTPAPLAITRLNPSSGAPGTPIQIEGTGFDPAPARNLVLIGGAEAAVLSVSPSSLTALVPTNAVTGEVTVTTPLATTNAPFPFTVTRTLIAQFIPPPGLAGADYRLVTPAVPGSRAPSATGSLSVRLDLPSLVMAIPTDPARTLPSFLSLTTGNSTSLTVNAQSTAEAMVALHPFFASPDPFIATRVIQTVQTNPAVAALAAALDRLGASTPDLFDHPDVLAAYEHAVIAVGTNAAIRTLARDLHARRQIARQTPSRPLGVYFLEDSETRFVEVERDNERFAFQGFPFNPVDWMVLIEEIHVDQAFPGGRDDFNELHQQIFLEPAFLPRRGTPRQFALVGADFFFSRFGILGYIAKAITSTIGDSIFDKGLQLPGANTIYAAYAFGPSFGPDSDRTFANTHFADQRNAVLVLNLAAAVLDAASALLDYGIFEDSQKRQELMTKLVTEAAKSAGTIRSTDQFLQLTMDLTAFLLKELATSAVEDGAKEAAEGALKTVGKTLTGVLKVLDIIGGVGQVAERASGLIRTTPLEEMLLVLGDPFQLQIDGVEPAGAAPGDTVDILIRNALFDRFDQNDAVYLVTSLEEIPLHVISATGDRTLQRVRVRIPDSTADLPTGSYSLTILADGRRGSTPFELVSGPTVRYLLPSSGFAVDPATSFFQPTRVQLSGFGFGPEDTFTFAGGARVTEKFGVTGSVTLTVPPGARSGPIHIRRPSGSEGDSPAFTLLGPPQIVALEPDSGPIGTRVALRIRNLSENPGDAEFHWLGVTLFNHVLTRSSNEIRLTFTIPDSSRTGAFDVRTPAGTDSRTFTVLPGRARGGSISVGGNSPISLHDALAYAAGTAVPPPDDGDFRTDPDTGNVVQLDPPYEHADFISGTVGAEFADTITVTDDVQGSFAMTGSYDTLTARIRGSLSVTGDNNALDVRVQDGPEDGLAIFGHNNRIIVYSDTHRRDGVRITGGRQNRIQVLNVSSNLGNGITLTGGAQGNTIVPGPRRFSSGNLSGLIRANQGHGVALLTAATGNILESGLLLSLNQADGLHLNGAGVLDNLARTVTAHTNNGNGIAITGGALSSQISGVSQGNRRSGVEISGGGTDFTSISVDASNNQEHGIAILADPTGSPTATSILTSLGSNLRHGVLIQGAVDPHGQILSDTISDNRMTGVRLEAGASGWTIRPRIVSGNATGVELIGATTRSNTVSTFISQSTGAGARLEAATSNSLTLSLTRNLANGIVLDRAHSNTLEITANANAGAGVLLTNGATANVVSNSIVSFNTNGIVVAAGSSNNLFTALDVQQNTDHGFVLRDPLTDFNTLQNSTFSRPGLDAIRIELGASHNLIGSPTATRTNNGVAISSQRIRAGIRITDPGTRNNLVQGVSVVTVASDTLNEAGIVVENGAAGTRIGAPDPDALGSVYLARCRDGILVRNNATDTRILNTFFWAIRSSGVNVDNAPDVTIGEPGGATRNTFQQSTTGITLQNPSTTLTRILGNRFLTNTVGVLVTNIPASGVHIEQNEFIEQHNDGIRIANARGVRVSSNLFDGNADGIELSADASDNLIANNSIQHNSIGIRVTGPGSLRNTIQGPGITANNFQGITLTLGGNRSLPAPILTDVTHNAVFGTANAPDGSRVALFSDPADEGAIALGSGRVFDGKFRVPVTLDLNAVGVLFQLTATVTDPDGNTSPFGRLQNTLPTPSPRIVFVSEHDGQNELALLQDSLATPTRLTSHPANDHQPALSPRATNIVFVSDRTGRRALHSIPPLPAQTPTLISPPAAAFDEYEPAWSPDARRIAFVSERDGNPEIYLANPDGSAPVRLTTDLAADRWPAFAPNGTNLVFLSNRSGSWHLAFVNIDGSNLRTTSLAASPISRPSWSPNGALIAFTLESNDDADILTTTPDATQTTPLIATPGRNLDPAWTPDGTYLIFASNRDGHPELHSYRISNTSTRRLTVSTTQSHSPTLASP